MLLQTNALRKVSFPFYEQSQQQKLGAQKHGIRCGRKQVRRNVASPQTEKMQHQDNLTEPVMDSKKDIFQWTKQWYPIHAVMHLDPSRPTGIQLLGKDLVIWRDVDGNWVCFEDQCPHRLVPLSEGRLETDGTLQCSYHGWRFNGKVCRPIGEVDYNQIIQMRELDNFVRRQSTIQEDLRSTLIQNHQSYVALCTMLRDEHPFIREWIQYHNYIGINKFYIYDHLSLPPMSQILEDYIMSGLVDYTYLTTQWLKDDYNLDKRPYNYNGSIHVNSPQRWAHLDCLLKHRNDHKFMAMIDVDEFIVLNQGKDKNYFPHAHPDLPNYLKQFEGTGGVFMQWRFFGSSGHVKRPDDLVLKSYTQCEPEHNSVTGQIKTIKHMVYTDSMKDMCIIHTCFTKQPSVNTEFVEALSDTHIPESWEGLVLNHYMYKSQQDFKAKLSKGGGHMKKDKYSSTRSWRDFIRVDQRTTADCSYMKSLATACCEEEKEGAPTKKYIQDVRTYFRTHAGSSDNKPTFQKLEVLDWDAKENLEEPQYAPQHSQEHFEEDNDLIDIEPLMEASSDLDADELDDDDY